MKVTLRLLLRAHVLLVLWALGASGGDLYPLTLKGTVYSVNGGGEIAGTATTQTIMLQSIADRAGIPVSNLALVYHIGGTSFGDTIDVIDRTEDRVLENLYGFYFGEDFARRALYSADGSDQRRLDYIYTRQAATARGSAVVTKKQVRVKGGGSRLLVSGSMQWIITPENGVPGQICIAKFTTGPKLSW